MSDSATIKFQGLTTATGASVAAAATALGDAIKALAITHPSWSVVEDVTLGTSSWRWIVLKCAATGSMPNDTYVLMAFLASSAPVVYVGESYNTSTHTLGGVCASGLAASTAVDATGRGATPTTMNPAASGAPQVPTGTFQNLPTPWNSGTLNATTIYWWMGFYDTHMAGAIATTQANLDGAAVYAGGFESLVPTPATNDPVRAICARIHGTSTQSGGTLCSCTSREPLQAASTSRQYAMQITEIGYGSWGTQWEYGRAQWNGLDSYNSAALALSRCLVVGTSYVSAEGSSRASLRGRFDDLLISAALTTANIPGLAPGDTISYNGTLWLVVGVTSHALVNTGVAG